MKINTVNQLIVSLRNISILTLDEDIALDTINLCAYTTNDFKSLHYFLLEHYFEDLPKVYSSIYNRLDPICKAQNEKLWRYLNTYRAIDVIQNLPSFESKIDVLNSSIKENLTQDSINNLLLLSLYQNLSLVYMNNKFFYKARLSLENAQKYCDSFDPYLALQLIDIDLKINKFDGLKKKLNS